MKKKDLLTLLSPSLFFLIIAVAGLGIGHGILTDAVRAEAAAESQKKFERFVENVENGTWQLTTDRWIEGMRRTRAVTEAQRQLTVSAVEIMRAVGWVALIGLGLQFLAVLTFRAKQNRLAAGQPAN